MSCRTGPALLNHTLDSRWGTWSSRPGRFIPVKKPVTIILPCTNINLYDFLYLIFDKNKQVCTQNVAYLFIYFSVNYWTDDCVLIFLPFVNTTDHTTPTQLSLSLPTYSSFLRLSPVHLPPTWTCSIIHPRTWVYKLRPIRLHYVSRGHICELPIHCKNYTLIQADIYTNLLLVFDMRTANQPTTTRHPKVRGPKV